ncbi:MAG: signal peptidase I [Candidatus Nomurabacteria bacterium]|jgi:signal peptidase|nr:signal peptidase I [Candidatus Nomurabacteria bacterium]
MKKVINKVLSNTFFIVCLAILTVVVVFCVLLGRADDFYVFGYKPFIIATGSMETNYMANSMVVVKKGGYDDVKKGDVIAFRAQAMGGKMAFHRVIEVTDAGFTTKGDHNMVADPALVARDNYIGREAFHTNATAYFINELNRPGGFVRVIALPVLAIMLIFAAVYIIRNWEADIRVKLLAVFGFVLAASILVLVSYVLWNGKRVEYTNETLASLASRFNSSEPLANLELNNNKVIGTLKIETLGINYPIIKYSSPDSLEQSITWFAGAGLNENGNAVLAGNLANGKLFFTDLDYLRKGDKAVVVDASRHKVEYVVIDSFVTDPNDKSVLRQDRAKRELTLISCQKDLGDRYIVKLEAKQLK